MNFASGEDDGRTDEDGCPGYSDKAVVNGWISWAVCGDEWAKAAVSA